MRKILIISAVIAFYLLFSIIYIFPYHEQFPSPDEKVEYEFIKDFKIDSQISFSRDPINNFNNPRHTYIFNNQLYPATFPYFYFESGVLAYFTYLPTLPIIYSILLLFGFFLFSRKISNKNYLFIFPLISLFPIVLYWSGSFYNNILSLALIILSLAMFFDFLDKRKNNYFILFILFFSICVLIRSELIIFSLIFALSYIFDSYIKKIKLSFFKVLFIFIIPLFFVITVNYHIYGVIFKNPYDEGITLSYYKSSNNLPALIDRIFPIKENSFEILNNNLSLYILNFFNLFFFMSVIGIFYFIREKNTSFSKKFLIFGLIFISILFYFIREGYYGYNDFSIRSSYPRYIMLVYILFMLFFSSFLLLNKNLSKKVRIILLASFLIWSLVIVSNELVGVIKVKLEHAEFEKKMVNIIPQNSIIITNYWDKVFFPYYNILTFNHWNKTMENERFLLLLKELEKSNNKEVYIFHRNVQDWEFVKNELNNEKINLTSIDEKSGLYKIIFLNKSSL